MNPLALLSMFSPRAWRNIIIAALIASAVTVLVVAHQRAAHRLEHAAEQRIRQEWSAADKARREADDETQRLNRRSMDTAAATFEAQRREMEARRAVTSPEAQAALQRPICPPGAASAALGDLRIDAALVRGLRDAGSELDPPGPAASEPGR